MVYQLDTPGLEDQAVTTEKIDTAAVTLSQAASSLTNALVPVKGIIMFSGTAAEVPANWNLCDGTNGTPDLRNKFVIAAQSYDAATDNQWETNITGTDTASGGSKDAIVVEHGHTVTVDSNTTGITASASNVGNHSHQYKETSENNQSRDPGGAAVNQGANGGAQTGGAGAHTHTITITDNGHTHTGSATDAGSSGTNANLPPYFALAFIMRVT